MGKDRPDSQKLSFDLHLPMMSPASSLTQTMILNNHNGNNNPGEVVRRACQPGGSILNFYNDYYFIHSYLQKYLINSKSLVDQTFSFLHC